MSSTSPAARWRVDDVPTPALLIDPTVVERNLARMQGYATEHGLRLRPHTKTHKSVHVAARQIAHGAVGLTVAKAGEAEVMARVEGCDDLLVAYPVFDPARRDRVAALARGGLTVRVGVDSALAVDLLAEAARAHDVTLGFLVDLDVGFRRTGVQSAAEAVALARHVDRTRGARLDGVMFYAGHIKARPTEQAASLGSVATLLAEVLDAWHASGLRAPIVSGGSTPTALQSHALPQLTEIRPGTYAYQDMNGVRGGHCALDDCAASLACTVISTAVPGKVVVDAGSKTLTSDRNSLFSDSGFGHVVEYPQAKVVRLSEEHGELDVTSCDRRPKLGDRVRIIPNHICPCVNLQDRAWLLPDEGAADGYLQPLPIDARGRLS
jgi:D-serine deaminase-like pyridoxal phosphate-dependent protein